MIWATGGVLGSEQESASTALNSADGPEAERDRSARGHADIVRELIDGAAGDNDGNLPDQTAQEWAAYRLQLEEAAVEAAQRAEMGDPSQPRTPH